MDRRLQLSEYLHTIAPNVYFQPPSNIVMQYPAIVYEPDFEERNYANNGTYGLHDRWQVTIIDRDPDSEIRQAFRQSPMCAFDRSFRTEGLNHFIYSLYN
jgi:hypothetical protein